MANFSEAMRAEARELALRGTVLYPGGSMYALSGGDIASFSISEGSEGGILPGDVLSASCQLVLDNSDGRWEEGGGLRGGEPLAGAAFSLELGVKADGAFIYSPLGTYVCDEASADENGATIALTLYDAVYSRTAGAFEDFLGYPRTVSEIWGELCGNAGLAFSGTVPGGSRIVDWPPSWGEITVRTAMGFVAAACGCFARVNRLGELELVSLVSAEAATEILPEAYLSRKKLAASFGPVNAVRVTTVNDREEDDAQPYEISIEPEGTAETCVLQVTGNPLFVTGGAHTYAMAAGMLSLVTGLSYAACRFSWRGDPTLVPGAKLSVVGVDGSVTQCALSRQTIKFDGGFSAECVSGAPDVETSAKEISPSGGVKAGQIIGVVRGANISASSITTSKLAAGAITADKIVAGAVTAGKIAAGAVTAGTIDAAAVTALKIAAGAVTAEKLDAGAVTADKIAAGAIEADKIAAGAVEADKIAAGAITADKIEANAITAEQIAAGTITADRCVAGMVSAESGLIANGAIGTAQIADGSITSAKIVELTADLIKAGTLSVDRLLITGADSIVYEFNATSGGLTAAQLSQAEYRNRLSGTVIVAESITSAQIAANAITTNKILANTITADKVNITDLFASKVTADCIRTMTVASLENGTVLTLNENRAVFRTPEFLVEIPGAEEGEEKLRIDADGVYTPALDSPTVARRVPGGVYTVGSGRDYETLADAFDELNGAVLDGDVVLKLSRDDAGGELRGIAGGHSVTIVSGNLIDPAAVAASAATLTTEGTYGYKVTADSAGTYRTVKVLVGRVGDMELAGKNVTMAVGAITSSGGTYQSVSAYLYDDDYSSNALFLGNLTTANTTATFQVPIGTDDDRVLALVLFVSAGTSCAAGAYTVYDSLRAEIGDSVYGWPTIMYRIADLRVIGCASRVNIARAVIPATVEIRGGETVISRSSFYGALGVLAYMARVILSRNRGVCTQAVKAVCSQVYVTGPAPSGTYDGWLVDTTTASVSGGGTAPTETTKTLTANSTGTYTTYWWSGDRSVRQGYTVSNGRIRGGMWWDFSAIPSGATVTGMQLTIKRMANYGKGDAVTVKAYGTASSARSGQPALSSAGYVLGTIGEGKTKTFDLPAALVTGLAAGTYKGIVLYADDTAVLNDKTYSTNYARMEGTDGTAPRLAVTYTA